MPIVNPNGTGPKNRPKPKIASNRFFGNVHQRSNVAPSRAILNRNFLVQPHEKTVVTVETRKGTKAVVITSPSGTNERTFAPSFYRQGKKLSTRPANDSTTPKFRIGK